MKAEHTDEMPRKYDAAPVVRGAFADRWTPEQRERGLHGAIVESARAWHEFALTRVQALEAALFTYLSLSPSSSAPGFAGGDVDTRPFRALSPLVEELHDRSGLARELQRRLLALRRETEWAAEHGLEGAVGAAPQRLAHKERLERIGREADALKSALDQLVQEHLARSGMSEQEIERKTEETAKLWLAA